MNAQPRIVYCHCAYAQVVPADVKQDVLRRLTESGTSFDAVADLCEMAARRDPWLEGVARQDVDVPAIKGANVAHFDHGHDLAGVQLDLLVGQVPGKAQAFDK